MTITIIIILIVKIMKALTKIKVVLIIRLITPLQPPLTDLKKKTVFILRDSMVKKLNSFLLTRKPNRKCLVKVRSVNSAKVRCMHDHTKSTVRDFDPDYIILHCGTNDPNSDRKSSQIAGEIIDRSLIRITFQFYY